MSKSKKCASVVEVSSMVARATVVIAATVVAVVTTGCLVPQVTVRSSYPNSSIPGFIASQFELERCPPGTVASENIAYAWAQKNVGQEYHMERRCYSKK